MAARDYLDKGMSLVVVTVIVKRGDCGNKEYNHTSIVVQKKYLSFDSSRP
jgi:hypothetical protein